MSKFYHKPEITIQVDLFKESGKWYATEFLTFASNFSREEFDIMVVRKYRDFPYIVINYPEDYLYCFPLLVTPETNHLYQ